MNSLLSGNVLPDGKQAPSSVSHAENPFVLHVRVVSGTGGGPDKTILNSPARLRSLGYRAACVYLRSPDDSGFEAILQRAAKHNAEVVAIDDFGFFDWRIVNRIDKIISRLKPAIWHGHDYKSNLLGLLLRRRHPGMKLVTTVHGWVEKTWKTPLYYAIDRRCLPRYDQVICVSGDLYSDCQRIGVPKSRLSLIENAIVLDDYPVIPEQASAKRQLGFPPDQLLVAGVGRLSAEKGFDILIDVVAKLNESGCRVSLAIAGQGDERCELDELIARRGCQETVRLLGFVADPRRVYQAADVFALSSLREGLPNVVLEAMASGRPVVATRVAGIPNLIENDVNGKLVEAGSREQLQLALRNLLDDPVARKRLGTSARKTVEMRFDFDRRMERVVSVYQRLGLTKSGS